MNTARLGDVIADVKSGFASGEDVPNGVVQVRMHNVETDGSWNWQKVRRVPASASQIRNNQLLPGDVLFNATNSPTLVGKSALFMAYDEPVVFSNHFLRLRVKSDVLEPRFLARWLARQWCRHVFEGLCTQWVNQATVRRDDLLSLAIPLPALPEQRRIAAILDKADGLRRKRAESIQLLDDLLRATFLDMFGDPVTNPKGWDTKTIGEMGQVTTGNTPSRKVPEYYGEAIEWIKSDNINTRHHILTRASEDLSEAGKAEARTVPAGSILVTCIAGSPACIGNAALADREVAFNQQINAITPFEGVNTSFLYTELLLAKDLVQRQSTDSMKGMVSKQRFSAIRLPCPPREFQVEFGRCFGRIAAGIKRADEAEGLSNSLFNSLVQRAFLGEI